MRGTLTEQLAEGPISPLVDVVFNAMAAMFVFLVIYISVVQPQETPELRIYTEALPAAVWNKPYQSGVAASGGEGAYRFHVLGGLPDGLTISPTSGLISGHPRPQPGEEGESAAFEVEVQVKDPLGHAARAVLPLTVEPYAWPFDPDEHPLALQFEGDELPRAWVGQPYRQVLGPQGGIEPYRTVVEGQRPTGLQCTDGVLAGVPTRAGSYEFRIRLEDAEDTLGVLADPQVHARAFRLQVIQPDPLEVRTTFPRARVGEPYSGTFVASGGVPPYRWRGIGPVPAEGLDWTPDGAGVEGVPTSVGSTTIAAEVEDALGTRRLVEADLQVLPERSELRIATGDLPPARVGAAFDVAFSVEGAVAPVTWRMAEGELPAGLELSDGRLRGIPRPGELRRYSFSVEVRDALDDVHRSSLGLRLLPARPSLTLGD